MLAPLAMVVCTCALVHTPVCILQLLPHTYPASAVPGVTGSSALCRLLPFRQQFQLAIVLAVIARSVPAKDRLKYEIH